MKMAAVLATNANPAESPLYILVGFQQRIVGAAAEDTRLTCKLGQGEKFKACKCGIKKGDVKGNSTANRLEE